MTNFKIFAAIIVAIGLFITLGNSGAQKRRKKERNQSLERIEAEFKKYETTLVKNSQAFQQLDVPTAKPVLMNALDESDAKTTGLLLEAYLQSRQDSAMQKDGPFRFNDSVQTHVENTTLTNPLEEVTASDENRVIIKEMEGMSEIYDRMKNGKWSNPYYSYHDTSRIGRQIRKLAQLKYVAVAVRTLKIKPHDMETNYEAGYIIGKLKVYQLTGSKLVGEAVLFAQSSNRVTESVMVMKGDESSSKRVSEFTLLNDLAANFNKEVRKKLNFGIGGY
jgi:hypothetical protein